MKILHVYKDYSPVLGGIENHLRALAEAQAAAGHAVSVLVTALPGAPTTVETHGGVRVLKAARLATVGGSVPISLALPRLLARERPDVAHLHFPYPLGELSQLAFGHARATVLTYHSDVVRQRLMLRLYRPLLWQILRRADRLIATSPHYVQTSPFLSRLAARCRVIPLGVDVARFARADPAAVAALRAEWSPAGEPVLLFVGRLRYYKGLDVLLDALARLPEGRATAVLVGAGPERAALEAQARALGLGARVRFAGDLADERLPAAYHAADLFVLPASARAEAFGMVLVEAMAAGLACITTAVGSGTDWVVQHGVTGLVVAPRDPEALAAALAELLADPGARRAFGAAGQARAAAEFSHERMVAAVLALYAEVLADREGG
jgi:rhamnosyl/mannosyltransferase